MEVGLRLGLALALALALNYNANVSPLSGDWRPRPKVKCNSTAQQGLRCACLITFHSSFELREKKEEYEYEAYEFVQSSALFNELPTGCQQALPAKPSGKSSASG